MDRFLPSLSNTHFERLQEINADENQESIPRPSNTNKNLQKGLSERVLKISDFSHLIDYIIRNLKNLKLLSNSKFENIETNDENRNKMYWMYASLEKIQTFTKDFANIQRNQPQTINTENNFPSNLLTDIEISRDNIKRKFTPVIDKMGKFYGTSMSSGFGTMIYRDNGFYVGNWNGRQKHGKGVYIWNDGAVFIGEFDQNKPKKGCMMYANLDSYEGEFNNNRRNGKGIYFFSSSKNCHKGLWENGKFVQNQSFE